MAGTHRSLHGSLKVLLDALTVKYVPTLGLYSVLCELIAESADSTFALLVLREDASVVLASDNKIGMAGHLSHPGKQAEDIGVVCAT